MNKDDFTNDLHYEYYRRYVGPKLSVINKEYVVKVFGRSIKKRTSTRIYISDHYIVITFIVDAKNMTKYVFVVGINDDGKLFVNKIFLEPVDADIVSQENGCELYIVQDEEIQRILQFEYNAVQEDIVVDTEGAYRVQGEVVIEAMNGPCDLHSEVDYSPEVKEYIDSIYRSIVAANLQVKGFSIEMRRWYIVLPLAVKRGVGDDDKVRMAKAIELAIGNQITVGGLKFRYNIYISTVCRYGETYCDLLIRVDPECVNDEHDACMYIYNQIHSAINELKVSTFRHVLGNHVIEVRNVYSNSMIIEPQLPDEIRELAEMIAQLRAIEIHRDRYCVDKDSEIVISHNEHGITRVRFNKPFLVNIRTTAVGPDYPFEINRILLSKLLKQFISKEKKET